MEELGLSNAEAKIYMALLELGPSKTGKVIDRTKLQSSTVYHVLGSLVEKGIVSYILKGKMKLFQAESPDSLSMFLEEKRRKLDSIMPELKEKEKLSKQKQSAKVYEGVKGLKTAFNDILTTMKSGEEYYFFQVNTEQLKEKKLLLFLRNYHLKRSEKGIKAKGLAGREDIEMIKKHIQVGLKNIEVRCLDEFMPNGVVIYKDKVLTLDWQDVPTAFVIQSQAVANSYKKFFEQKWNRIIPSESFMDWN